MRIVPNSIPRIDEVVKFVTGRIGRFIDPAGFLFPINDHDKHYLSPRQVDRLIQGFIPGKVDITGWGDLMIHHYKDGYRLWASVNQEAVYDTYCDIHMINRYSDDWSMALTENGLEPIYHEVSQYVAHTYMDDWTGRIVREVPAEIEYITRRARQYRKYV